MGVLSAVWHLPSLLAFPAPWSSVLQLAAAAAAGYGIRHFQAPKNQGRETGSLPPSLFKQAIQHSASGLVICDAQQPDLPIVYVSPSFEALTGYVAEEAIGQNCRFMQRKDRDQLGIGDIRRAIAQGTGCKVLLRNYHKSGRAFWNELTRSPIKDAAGTVTHYAGTQVDISHYLETFKALQESELRYQHLYEETPAMLHSIDRKGRIVSVSHHWLEKLGYERHEVVGQPISAFLTEASNGKMAKVRWRRCSPEASQTQSNETCRDLPCRLIRKDGKRLDALLSTVAECGSNESISSSLGVLMDITERKKTQENLRRSEALLRAINDLPPTGIFVMDCNSSKALFINSEFYRIWQMEPLQAEVAADRINGEQLLSECLSTVDLGAFVATSTAKDFTEGNKIVEDEMPLLDGRTLRRIYGPIQEDNTTFAFLYVFEDITERKQAVQKLAEATAAAEAANRAKSEFLANMSHELRSPLNAILGFTHILKDSKLQPQQRENLEIVHRSGEHLLALINDVLDISKIEAGRVELHESEFDLYRLLDELQQMFDGTAKEKGLALAVVRSPNLPQIIYSDRLKLRQILINLLGNAVKFTAEGVITLTVQTKTLAEQGSSSLDKSPDRSGGHLETRSQRTDRYQPFTFAVTDTGPGISKADQDKLFEAFVQTESGLNTHQGTGLGLAISCEYAQLLGGQLNVVSTLGEGATFSLSLMAIPVKASVDASAEPPIADKIVGLAPEQPSYRILVVDDVALNRKLLYQLLVNVGFDVHLAINGQEAIAQWQSWQPHLIWMDMRMPVMDGAQATWRIKALDVENQTLILALTASAFEENKAAALTSGCDDFVTKPIQAQEIFEKMTQYLGVRYLYDTAEPPASLACEPITPALLANVSIAWCYALTQAILDLDDDAILQLAADLPESARSLATTLRKCVSDLSYKKLLQVLQEAEAVRP